MPMLWQGGGGAGGEGMADGNPRIMPQIEKPPDMLAFERGREVLDALRHKLGPLASVMETMLHEIAGKFMARPEERLMAVVYALLHRYLCFIATAFSCSAFPLSRVTRSCLVPWYRKYSEGIDMSMGPWWYMC